jgi:hypothetical protein
MSLLSSPTTLAAAETGGRHLPMAPLAFGLIAISLFLLALAFLWSFRNTAAKTGQHDHGAHH